MRRVAWPPAGLWVLAERRRRCSPTPGPVPGSAHGEGRCSWGAGRRAVAPGSRARPTAPVRTLARAVPRSAVRPRPRTAQGRSPWRPPLARGDALEPLVWPPSAVPRPPPAPAAAVRPPPSGRIPPVPPRQGCPRRAGGSAYPAARLHLKPPPRADEIPPQLPARAMRLPSLLACHTSLRNSVSVRLLRFDYGSADLMTAWVVHKGDEGATPGLMHARWDEGERWPLGDWPGRGVDGRGN